MAGEIKALTLYSWDLAQLNTLPDEFEFEIMHDDLSGLPLSVGMDRVHMLRSLMSKLHALKYSSAITEDHSRNVYRYRFKRRKALPSPNIHPDAIDI